MSKKSMERGGKKIHIKTQSIERFLILIQLYKYIPQIKVFHLEI
jgi:hypothetical protein